MKLLFSFALCLITLPGFCQHEDYLVKNNGDTLVGDITLRNKVFYVSGTPELAINADEVVTVKSGNFKGNTVLHCTLLTYSDNLTDLQIDYINKGSIDTVLILNEVYSTPKIKLYYTVSKDKTPFYFYKTPSDSRPVQLVVRYFLQGGLANYDNDRIRYRGQRSYLTITEDKGYVNQLQAIMGNCKKITPTMWEMLTYRIYSLKKIIKTYNRCK